MNNNKVTGLGISDIRKSKSSYQRRLYDLAYAWKLLSQIRNELIKKHDGLSDEDIINEITEIIDDAFIDKVDDVDACPICGIYSGHYHSFE